MGEKGREVDFQEYFQLFPRHHLVNYSVKLNWGNFLKYCLLDKNIVNNHFNKDN